MLRITLFVGRRDRAHRNVDLRSRASDHSNPYPWERDLPVRWLCLGNGRSAWRRAREPRSPGPSRRPPLAHCSPGSSRSKKRLAFRSKESVCACVWPSAKAVAPRANPSPRRSLRSGARVSEGLGSAGSRNARVQTCPSNSTTSSLWRNAASVARDAVAAAASRR